ncbi:MAG: TMEM175 family protein [Actinomycetota bacterium]
MSHPAPPLRHDLPPEGTLAPQRAEALSDAVFAISATILVLNIAGGAPRTGRGHVWSAIVDARYSYIGYAMSFAVIGLVWVSHHGMFDRLRAVDRPLLFSNLALLCLVAFIPWPTALLAEFIGDGGRDASVATAFYSFVMTLIGLVFTFQWWHLTRRPALLRHEIADDRLRRSLHRAVVGPAVYALTVPLAFVSPLLCLLVYVVLSGYFASGPSSRALRTGRTGSDPAPTAGDAPS